MLFRRKVHAVEAIDQTEVVEALQDVCDRFVSTAARLAEFSDDLQKNLPGWKRHAALIEKKVRESNDRRNAGPS